MELKIASKKYGEKIILIDDEDYDKIKKHKIAISYDPSSKNFYAKFHLDKSNNYKTCFLHRFIMNTEKGKVVDHINHNTLDNRKENLRNCLNSENIKNIKKEKYKGVSYFHANKKYLSRIKVDGKSIFLGYFKNQIDAAIAYNKAALKHHGNFAFLNIISVVTYDK